MNSSSKNQWVEIQVADDATMPVYVCTPETGKPRAAILVIQEVFGVNSHIRTTAERIAAEGYLTLAPDLFHRQGRHFEAPYSEIESARARAAAMKPEQVFDDLDRVLATLDKNLSVGVVGFCMGGTLAFQLATHPRISASTAFYGTRITEKGLGQVSKIQCPLLLLFGEEDSHIPPADIAKIREALHEHNKEAEIVVYPHAGHGFFCEQRTSYQAHAAQDAWKRFLEFTKRWLPSQ